MITVLLGMAFVIVWFCPDTELGRALKRVLVDWPAQKLARMTRRKLVVRLAMLTLVLGAIAAAKLLEDGVMFLQFVPDGIGWIAAVDVTAYFEIMAAAWLIAATVRLRTIDHAARVAAARGRQCLLQRCRAALVVLARGLNAVRQLRVRITSARKADDEDRHAPAMVFA